MRRPDGPAVDSSARWFEWANWARIGGHAGRLHRAGVLTGVWVCQAWVHDGDP